MGIRSRTLATRFSLMYLALVISVLAVGAAAYWTVARWGELMAGLTQDYGQALQAEHLRADVNRLAKELTELLLGDPNASADLDALREAIAARLDELVRNAAPGAERRSLLRVVEMNGRIGERAARMQALLARGERAAAFRLSELEIEKGALPDLQIVLDDVRRDYLTRERQALQEAGRAQRGATLLSMGILLLAAVQLAFFTVFLQRRFRNPIEEISRGTRRMREGDLHHEIVLPHADELGALATDITDMARSLRESRERLVRNERLAAVGEVAATLAHNLRNPLAGIRSAAQAALEEADDATLCRETFGDIMLTVDKLATWTQDILRYTSPLPPRCAPVRPEALLDAVKRLATATLSARGVDLRSEAAAHLTAMSLDGAAMEQALLALVLNAAEAVAPGACVDLRAERGGGEVILSVTDEGRGMPENVRAQAVRPFYTTKPKGMGLGLAMADKVARAHGGTLQIDSAPGRGTTVRIRLPGARHSEPE